MNSAQRALPHWLGAVALLVVAAFLRPPVAAVGPLLPEIGSSLQLSPSWLSVLGAIPVFGFGFGAFITPLLARRVDNRAVLIGVVLVLLAAVMLRSSGTTGAMFAGTAAIGLAIAVGNTILPSIVRTDFADRISLMTGLYTTVMAGSAGVAALVAVPLAGADGTDWQSSLRVPVLIGLAALLLLLLPTGHRAGNRNPSSRADLLPLLRNKAAWQITLFMGFQSIGFYAMLTWLPTLLQANGYSPIEAGRWLSYATTIGLPVGLAMHWVEQRLGGLANASLLAGGLVGSGFAGLALAPTAAPWLWLALCGLGLGLSFPVALAMIAARAHDQATTTALSAMAQGFGYLIAGVGTWLVGSLHSLTSSWTTASLVLAVFGLTQAWLGAVAGGGTAVHAADGRDDRPTK